MPAQPGKDGNGVTGGPVTGELMEPRSAIARRASVNPWQVGEQLLLARQRDHEPEDEVCRQLAFYRALTCSLGEAVCAIDLAGRFTFVNPAAEQVLGQMEAELLGRDAYSIMSVHDNNDPGTLAPPSPLLKVMREGTTYRTENALFTRGGSVFDVTYSAAPIVVEGRVVGAVVAFRDVTEVRRLQQARDEYVALLSHDLRTPLSTIIGSAQLLHRRLAPQEREQETRWAEAIVTSGQRMNSMIKDVLDRAFQQAGGAAPSLPSVDLVRLCQRMTAEMDSPTEASRIHLHAAEPVSVAANPTLIERVLANLLGNALKYSPPGSPVVIRVSSDDHHAVVAVADEGVGIDPQDLPQLFEKFQRTRTAGQIEGDGLGLYGSRVIVEAHGGQIWAESEVGVGSTFQFSLPISPP